MDLFLPCIFQITIVAPGAVLSEESTIASLHHQQVALLATANGTHIAVQVLSQNQARPEPCSLFT